MQNISKAPDPVLLDLEAEPGHPHDAGSRASGTTVRGQDTTTRDPGHYAPHHRQQAPPEAWAYDAGMFSEHGAAADYKQQVRGKGDMSPRGSYGNQHALTLLSRSEPGSEGEGVETRLGPGAPDKPNTFLSCLRDGVKHIGLMEAVPIMAVVGTSAYHYLKHRSAKHPVPYKKPEWVRHLSNIAYAQQAYGMLNQGGMGGYGMGGYGMGGYGMGGYGMDGYGMGGYGMGGYGMGGYGMDGYGMGGYGMGGMGGMGGVGGMAGMLGALATTFLSSRRRDTQDQGGYEQGGHHGGYEQGGHHGGYDQGGQYGRYDQGGHHGGYEHGGQYGRYEHEGNYGQGPFQQGGQGHYPESSRYSQYGRERPHGYGHGRPNDYDYERPHGQSRPHGQGHSRPHGQGHRYDQDNGQSGMLSGIVDKIMHGLFPGNGPMRTRDVDAGSRGASSNSSSSGDLSQDVMSRFDDSVAVQKVVAEHYYRHVYQRNLDLRQATAQTMGGAAAIKTLRDQERMARELRQSKMFMPPDLRQDQEMLGLALWEVQDLLSRKAALAPLHPEDTMENIGRIALATIIRIRLDEDDALGPHSRRTQSTVSMPHHSRRRRAATRRHNYTDYADFANSHHRIAKEHSAAPSAHPAAPRAHSPHPRLAHAAGRRRGDDPYAH
ncbi:hypothetical protein IWQ56_001912 [Coemansia nantahalensis]|nr:hypothetical protein IWQ56_001912 [Coemansia nantahalensis]